MFGLWKNKAMPQTAQSRNPNYAKIFYDLLEKNARATNLSRDKFDSMFGTFDERYAECKAGCPYRTGDTSPTSFGEFMMVASYISAFTTTILSMLSVHSDNESKRPKYYYAFGYGNGLILIGEVLFALAPGLSKHGLQEAEEISKSVISKVMDDTSGASLGLEFQSFQQSPIRTVACMLPIFKRG